METAVEIKDKTPINKVRAKGGAPKKKVKREFILRIRMTATERFQIASKAKTAGMRPSTWIRTAAKSAKVVPRLSLEERRILWMLAELSNNLNQLTKLAHQQGLLRVVQLCQEVLTEIDHTLKYLNHDDRQSHDW